MSWMTTGTTLEETTPRTPNWIGQCGKLGELTGLAKGPIPWNAPFNAVPIPTEGDRRVIPFRESSG